MTPQQTLSKWQCLWLWFCGFQTSDMNKLHQKWTCSLIWKYFLFHSCQYWQWYFFAWGPPLNKREFRLWKYEYRWADFRETTWGNWRNKFEDSYDSCVHRPGEAVLSLPLCHTSFLNTDRWSISTGHWKNPHFQKEWTPQLCVAY